MRNRPAYSLEKAFFTDASDALNIVRERGISNKTGLDALIKVVKVYRPALNLQRIMQRDPETSEYLTRMGKYVELAASLSNPVDQQG